MLSRSLFSQIISHTSLRTTEPMRKEKAFFLRIFMRDINIHKSMISCCATVDVHEIMNISNSYI